MVQVGNVFGRWTTIEYLGYSYWLCRCSCGVEKRVWNQNLKSGASLSCGCLRKELMKGNQNTTTHGMTNTVEFSCWSSMRERCHNPDHAAWKDYGGRGIKICQRWDKFENFYEDMGEEAIP